MPTLLEKVQAWLGLPHGKAVIRDPSTKPANPPRRGKSGKSALKGGQAEDLCTVRTSVQQLRFAPFNLKTQ